MAMHHWSHPHNQDTLNNNLQPTGQQQQQQLLHRPTAIHMLDLQFRLVVATVLHRIMEVVGMVEVIVVLLQVVLAPVAALLWVVMMTSPYRFNPEIEIRI